MRSSPRFVGDIGSWAHRTSLPSNLKGIVEVDETYVLESQKGNRNLDRKAHRRGGKACKRGLSDELVPILVAVDRSGTTTCSVLPSVTADNVQAVLEPRIEDDIILVTDGNNVYPPCAKSLGIKHEALNQSAGERVRGAIHIQTVNNRHSRFKDFLHRFRGVSTKYLGNYLRWFERRDIMKSSPRSYLATAIGDPGARFANLAFFKAREYRFSLSKPVEWYRFGKSVLLGKPIPCLFKSIRCNEYNIEFSGNR